MKPEEYDKLTDEEIKVIIAKLDGYEFRPHTGTGVMYWRKSKNTPIWTEGLKSLPNYPNDLNCIHELEIKYICQEGGIFYAYRSYLRNGMGNVDEIICASAKYRCKAFVLTMEEKHL